ncbi:bifunctional glycosyltransferase family 2/GtrA family protein [Actinomyces culturomici]|uniref:bifunctional glycosyltransferase family 2/GtrA family protein n=1 Tax=Actinomyces culturomici TaxID=1926276 RepID=UPI001576D549|nr:bifunctional glycosyltransferase family 2/GtrA family protein [Actinomyces culturomici]
MIVLIPAYQPDTRLAGLVLDLHRADPSIETIVVDDGSGPNYRVYFDAARAAGADVVSYETNRGKGHALKTGLRRALAAHPGKVVVTADADGQHAVSDVLAVGRRCEDTGDIVLGVREFVGEVPLRSRFGNSLTAVLFRAATGVKVTDTQTGLRAFPAADLAWLAEVEGDRYEYELSVLLQAAESGLPLVQVPIATIYEDGNATSHFRPLQDSARIYAPLLKFSAASLAGFVVDYVSVLSLHALLGGLLVPVVGARVISASVNYALNRRVFKARRGTVARTAARYAALAVALVAASYAGLWALTGLSVPLWLAKPVVDVALYLASYRIQKKYVFTECEGGAAREEAESTPLDALAARAVSSAHPLATATTDRAEAAARTADASVRNASASDLRRPSGLAQLRRLLDSHRPASAR